MRNKEPSDPYEVASPPPESSKYCSWKKSYCRPPSPPNQFYVNPHILAYHFPRTLKSWTGIRTLVNLDQELIRWGKTRNWCLSWTDIFLPWGVLYLIISYGKPPWSAVSFIIWSKSGLEKGGLVSWPRSGCWVIRNMVACNYYRLSFRARIWSGFQLAT